MANIIIVESYGAFNFRRYSNPWVAIMVDGKPDFSAKVGGYTGKYNKGEAGDLYITNPVEGAVYAYGQKDYKGNNTEMAYLKYVDGELVGVDKLGRAV